VHVLRNSPTAARALQSSSDFVGPIAARAAPLDPAGPDRRILRASNPIRGPRRVGSPGESVRRSAAACRLCLSERWASRYSRIPKGREWGGCSGVSMEPAAKPAGGLRIRLLSPVELLRQRGPFAAEPAGCEPAALESSRRKRPKWRRSVPPSPRCLSSLATEDYPKPFVGDAALPHPRCGGRSIRPTSSASLSPAPHRRLMADCTSTCIPRLRVAHALGLARPSAASGAGPSLDAEIAAQFSLEIPLCAALEHWHVEQWRKFHVEQHNSSNKESGTKVHLESNECSHHCQSRVDCQVLQKIH
jgi:hypothetical protein